MRRKNLLWTCLIALLLISAGSAVTVTFGAAAKMEVDPPLVEDIYYPGNFTVDITITNVNDLYGWGFTLSFNPSVLNITSHIEQVPIPVPPFYENVTVYHVYEGPFLNDTGYETMFVPEINNAFGEANALAMLEFDPDTGAWPPEGADGSGVLATIEFTVIGTGVCVLDLDYTELSTVKGEPPYQYVDYIPHTAADGLFDNRIENELPVASFDIKHPGMILPVVDQPITFDASASYDDDGWLISYDWDFGDDTTDSGMVVDHVFTEVGSYTVSLTVTDNDGATDTDSCTVNVVEWMEGGEFPDILDAWTEHYEWNEVAKGRELVLSGLVGNPTDELFEVYVEFTVYDRENGGKLGEVTTNHEIIEAGDTLQLDAIMDLRDTRWRVMRPHASYWSNARISVNHKYEVVATCYYRLIGSVDFEKGFAAKDFGFKVLGSRHDIAVLEVTTNATNGDIRKGDVLEIYVLIDNEGGNYDETFDITVICKGLTMGATVGERTVELKQQEKRIETFTLDTGAVDRTDIWIGNGTQTTFTTTRKPSVLDSEEVYVNQTLMTKPADYTINYDTGEITFTTAPGAGAEIEATYKCAMDLGFYKIKAELSILTFEEDTLDNYGYDSFTVVE
jgi:PKD repeat protein